nr:unnamed protein product [Digitaria exilis]
MRTGTDRRRRQQHRSNCRTCSLAVTGGTSASVAPTDLTEDPSAMAICTYARLCGNHWRKLLLDLEWKAGKWHARAHSDSGAAGGAQAPRYESAAAEVRFGDERLRQRPHSAAGRQMFQSMMCMVTAGKQMPDVEDVGAEYGFVLAPGAKRPDGWAYRFPSTNTTILYHWSSTLCDLEPLNPSDRATSYAMHLDRPPAFLKNNLHRFHVLILNTGHHWNRGKLRANKWEMYLGGAPNKNRNIAVIWKAKNFTIHSVVKWLDAQLPHHPQLKVFYRSISPRHFFNGDWNTGGRCDNTNPLAKGSGIHLNHSEDTDAEGAVRGTRIKLLDVTALSRLRDEGHISRYSIKATPGVQDCLHWCLPGVPDTWNEILAAQL